MVADLSDYPDRLWHVDRTTQQLVSSRTRRDDEGKYNIPIRYAFVTGPFTLATRSFYGGLTTLAFADVTTLRLRDV